MDNRLIIVFGMAHSGTTILTHILRQHPDIRLITNGSEAHLLENDWLQFMSWKPIEKALKSCSQRILLKRAWRSVDGQDWLLKHAPNACYVYCYKPLIATARSWSKPTSNVADWLRDAPFKEQEAVYVRCWDAAMDFAYHARHFKKFSHSELLKSPQETINDLTKWLGLPAHTYDTSAVSPEIDVKKII